jgi:hypothetical protein
VCVCECSPTAREWISRFTPNLVCLFLETRKRFQKGHNSEKMFWVRNSVTVVPAAWKLSMIEEHHQDWSCLFRRGYYRNKCHNPDKLSCVREQVKMVSVARKPSTIEERRKKIKLFVSAGRLQELMSQTRKPSWVRISVKLLGLGITL